MLTQDKRCISFHVNALPVAQPRHKVGTINGHARAYIDAKHPVHAFKATVRCAAPNEPPITGPVSLRLMFILPRPKAMQWKTNGPCCRLMNFGYMMPSARTRSISMIWPGHYP